MIKLINFRGYHWPDPLDKAPGFMKYLLLVLVNGLLSVLLIYGVTHFKIVNFNGFTFFGHHYGPRTTVYAEILTNSLLYSPLIILTRKCSSLIPYGIVFIPYFLMDLYIESHYRCSVCDSSRALWNYYDGSFVSGISPGALKFFVTLSFDAIVFGLVGLFISRLLAALIYRKKKYPDDPTPEEYENLFSSKWSDEAVVKPRRDLVFYLLRILGFGYLLYLLILLLGKLGPAAWPKGVADLIGMTYQNPALAINTYFKITLMIILAFTAAYNKSLRYYACLGLLAGHLASTAYSLFFHFAKGMDTNDPTNFLMTSAIMDGSLIVLFVWWMIRYKKDAEIFAPEKDFPIHFSTPLTLMGYLYKALFVVFALCVLSIIGLRVFTHGNSGLSAVYGSPDPMIGNTVTLYATLAVISFLLIKRERLRQHFFNAINVPLSFGAFMAIVWIIIGGIRGGVWIQTRHAGPVTVDWYFILYGILNLALIAVMVYFRRMYYNVDYSINSLGPSGAIDAIALTKAFFNANDKQSAAVLQSIDRYVGGIRGRKRGLLNLPFGLFENVLNFIYGLRPAFSTMERDEQRYYLRKYFFRNEVEKSNAFIPPLAELAFTIGTALNSIVSFANYSYINVRAGMGYVPPDARDRLQTDFANVRPPFNHIAPLPRDEKDSNNFKPVNNNGKLVAPRVTTPVSEPEIPDDCDYLIVGSGAGGSIAAYRLACEVQNPGKILVVESGSRYQPLQDFQDSEIDMMKKVYKEGGLQQTKKTSMTVLQGECVGGSTIVNNAVCFRMPGHVRKQWNLEFGLTLNGIDAEYDQIEKELHVVPLGLPGINERVAAKFTKGVSGYNAGVGSSDQLSMPEQVLVNHLDNVGDGNWNLGNKRMRKRSMLETYIPWSESRGVQILPNTTAVNFICSKNAGTADQVILRAANGSLKKIRVNKAIVVAGGAIASSHFLMRSCPGNKNIGRRLSCNFAFPVAFDFNEEIKAYDGDQITMAALDPQNRSAFETYFNPPAAFYLSSVPFFFDRRDRWINRYKYLLNFGSLIGSEPNGQIFLKADVLSGQAFTWELGTGDIRNIKYALETLIRLGQKAGSTRAIIPTKPGIDLDLTDSKNVDEFLQIFDDFPLRMKDIYIGTAHPQGGNMMAGAGSVHRNERVVTEHFKVDGYDNVFVADASIFPTSITINPQLTIMALSSMAAKKLLHAFP
jgi:choline dehydrogenase-like flavoprotein